ncbi:MAG: hypothetical protein FWG07_00695 [Treponema sp.]|nr:hypothetical protein [Treponema sp.]
MKNAIKWFGIIALVAVIGIDCGKKVQAQTVSNPLENTTWKADMGGGESITISFGATDFTMMIIANTRGNTDVETQNGIYTVSGDKVTITVDGESTGATLRGNALVLSYDDDDSYSVILTKVQ